MQDGESASLVEARTSFTASPRIFFTFFTSGSIAAAFPASASVFRSSAVAERFTAFSSVSMNLPMEEATISSISSSMTRTSSPLALYASRSGELRSPASRSPVM